MWIQVSHKSLKINLEIFNYNFKLNVNINKIENLSLR